MYYWRFLKYCLISEFNFLIITSFHFPSSRHHLSNDDFMEDTREDYLFYSVSCTTVVYSDMHMHLSSSYS